MEADEKFVVSRPVGIKVGYLKSKGELLEALRSKRGGNFDSITEQVLEGIEFWTMPERIVNLTVVKLADIHDDPKAVWKRISALNCDLITPTLALYLALESERVIPENYKCNVRLGSYVNFHTDSQGKPFPYQFQLSPSEKSENYLTAVRGGLQPEDIWMYWWFAPQSLWVFQQR